MAKGLGLAPPSRVSFPDESPREAIDESTVQSEQKIPTFWRCQIEGLMKTAAMLNVSGLSLGDKLHVLW